MIHNSVSFMLRMQGGTMEGAYPNKGYLKD